MSELEKVSNADVESDGDLKSLFGLFIDYNVDVTLEQKEHLIGWLLRKNWEGATPMEQSVKEILDPILPTLLESNGNVKFADEIGRTILHHFITTYVSVFRNSRIKNSGGRDKLYTKKQLNVIEYLIRNGASAIALDRFERSPLGIAIAKRRVDLLPGLLSDLNASNDQEGSVLHVLIDKYVIDQSDYQHYLNYVELIRKLLSIEQVLGLINKRDCNGMTAAHFAARRCYVEILEVLEDHGADMKTRGKDEDSLLMALCRNIGNVTVDANALLKTIEWLLEHEHVEEAQRGDYTALHYSAGCYTFDAVMSLVKAGVATMPTGEDRNLLHCAAMTGGLNVMRYLTEYAIDIRRCKSLYSLTLLHLIGSSYSDAKLKVLVERGFRDLNVCGNDDITPMHLASMMAHGTMVEVLARHGADVNCRTGTGQHSPLHLATMCANLRDVDVEESEAPHESGSLYAEYFERLSYEGLQYHETIHQLMQAGADVNAKDHLGRTPLHYATRIEHGNSIVSWFLKAGAHVNVPDARGSLPLHNALEGSNLTGLGHLLAFGADINEVDTPNPDTLAELQVSKPSFARRLVHHAIELKAVGLRVDALYEPYMPKYELHRQDCLKEIEQLKSHALTDAFSMYDFLRMSPRQQVTLRDSMLPAVLCKFAIYQTVLEGTLRQAIERRSLLEPANAALDQLTRLRWPAVCASEILSYVSNRDMRILCESAELD